VSLNSLEPSESNHILRKVKFSRNAFDLYCEGTPFEWTEGLATVSYGFRSFHYSHQTNTSQLPGSPSFLVLSN